MSWGRDNVMSCWANVMSCDVEIMWCHIVRSRQCDVMLRQCDVMWCQNNVMSCDVVTMWCHVMSLQCNVMWCWDNVMPCREVVNVMSLQCDVMSWGRDNVMLQYCGGQAGSCSVNLFFFWWFVMLALWFRPEFSEKRLKNGGGEKSKRCSPPSLWPFSLKH